MREDFQKLVGKCFRYKEYENSFIYYAANIDVVPASEYNKEAYVQVTCIQTTLCDEELYRGMFCDDYEIVADCGGVCFDRYYPKFTSLEEFYNSFEEAHVQDFIDFAKNEVEKFIKDKLFN